MNLGSTRELSGMNPVLKDPDQGGVDPVYWVFKGVTEAEWENCTIIASGLLGQEYPKTFGHYHPEGVPVETYHLIEGEGVLQMQRKRIVDGELKVTEVEEVVLITAKPGDEINITPEWGHSWSNIGKGPLISFDNWRTGHTPTDYEPMETQQGLAYYLVEENGEVKAVKNPKYQNLPEPQWLTAEEFKQRFA
jgi:glucose-6-phosphate isomerase, archaeal